MGNGTTSIYKESLEDLLRRSCLKLAEMNLILFSPGQNYKDNVVKHPNKLLGRL